MYHIKMSTTATIVLAALAAPLAAQEPQCALAFPSARPACNTAVDAMRAFHPLAGMIVSGGNPVLGTAGSLGGIGHLTVTARVNAIKASLPNPDSASQSQVPSSFHGAIPAPVVEGALGLLRGRGGFLSVDALGSAVLLPTSGVSGLSVDSNAAHIGGAALGIGYGARVGVLGGSFPVPAVSVSWMHRTLPRIQYGSLGPTFGTGDQFEFSMDVRADNYRAVASWKFVLVDLAGHRRRPLQLEPNDHSLPRCDDPDERHDDRHQSSEHPRGVVRERRAEPLRPEAGGRIGVPDREGPELRHHVLQLRPESGACLRRPRRPLRILSVPPSDRPWSAPSTSLCGVGGASLQIPSSARSFSRATRSSARGFTRITAGRTRRA